MGLWPTHEMQPVVNVPTGDHKLSKKAHSVLASFSNEVFVSAASPGKLPPNTVLESFLRLKA